MARCTYSFFLQCLNPFHDTNNIDPSLLLALENFVRDLAAKAAKQKKKARTLEAKFFNLQQQMGDLQNTVKNVVSAMGSVKVNFAEEIKG